MSTMQIDPLSSALFTASQSAVLGLLFSHPDEAFFLRQVVVLTGLGVGHVQRELNRLAGAGILVRSVRGRHVYFQANAESPIFAELRGIITKTVGAVVLLRHALAPLKLRAAFIYGSVARGEEQAASDLDVMAVGEASFAEVVAAVRPAEEQVKRAINPSVYRPGEFAAKIRAGNHFLCSVSAASKVFIIGGEDELGSLSEEQLDSPARNVRAGSRQPARHRRS